MFTNLLAAVTIAVAATSCAAGFATPFGKEVQNECDKGGDYTTPCSIESYFVTAEGATEASICAQHQDYCSNVTKQINGTMSSQCFRAASSKGKPFTIIRASCTEADDKDIENDAPVYLSWTSYVGAMLGDKMERVNKNTNCPGRAIRAVNWCLNPIPGTLGVNPIHLKGQ